MVICGPLFNKVAKLIVPEGFSKVGNIDSLGMQKTFQLEDTPGFGISIFTAMLPVILMSIATLVSMVQQQIGVPDSLFTDIIKFLGDASVAMIISLLFAIYSMGLSRDIAVKDLMSSCSSAAAGIGMMLLIIGGGGAFKQVLIDGGVGSYVAELFSGTSASPFCLPGAWRLFCAFRSAPPPSRPFPPPGW